MSVTAAPPVTKITRMSTTIMSTTIMTIRAIPTAGRTITLTS
ncbi:MAG TPA: hypothetical protein VK715_15450 [Steroidobacteraceae bacterium]|nr:hypothetical protein [Steroidobacteraceae bacterium]